jgi:3-oxoacyl-[acyl-carrier-protein] synthase-3
LNTIQTIITGTGSYIPASIKTNEDFITNVFYDEHQHVLDNPLKIIDKFEQITGINARRYADSDITTSGMAAKAAALAIKDTGIDIETIDQLIVAHNFGDVEKYSIQTDAVPSLASRVKHTLGIKNPACIPYDILFGCPGWLQGLIQADAFIKAGIAKKCLIVGTEALSRVIDIHDRDCMIFSDGAGAVIVEAKENTDTGILSSSVQSFTTDEVNYIYLGKSNLPEANPQTKYLKMQGRKVYEFALKHVPAAMKACLDAANKNITEVKKIFIHQANEKMDEAIIKELYKLYAINAVPHNIMPMNIHELGNSSVATIPTLFDMVRKGVLPEHKLQPGDIILFASVGAGMNINAVCYKL